MNRPNVDLEADLIHRRDNHAFSIDSPPPSIQDSNSDDNQVGGLSDISGFSDSIRFNYVAIMLYSVKIIASIYALLTSGYSVEYNCMSLSQGWIFAMLGLDVMNLQIASLKIKNRMVLDRIVEHRNRQFAEQRNLARSQPTDLETGNRIPVEDNEAIAGDTMDMINRTAKLTVLANLSVCLWAILFVSGMIIKSMDPHDQSSCHTPQTDLLLKIYVAVSILWLCAPIMFILLGCFCLPILMLVIWLFGGPKPASQSVIRKLPVKTYTANFCGEKECVICMVEYQEGDKIIELECSPLHYFHEECLKKWLKINGQCPVCRAEIGKKKAETTQSTESSARNTTH